MRYLLLLSFLGISYSMMRGQTFTESFETDGEGSRYESNEFTVGCNTDWFRRTFDGQCTTNSHNFRDLASGNTSNEDGTWYFAGSDVEEGNAGENPLGDGENAYLVMATQTVTGFNKFNLTLKLAGVDTNNGTFEGEETILIEYAFDSDIATGGNCTGCLPGNNVVNSGSYTTVGAFRANVPARRYQEDTDLDGTPDGTNLTSTFTDYTYSFINPGSPTNLSIRIQLQHDASSEDAAFDHIRLTSEFVVLPVELSDFSLSNQPNGVQLDWITQTETNNEGFKIQRSIDAKDWETIHFQTGQGSSREIQSYSYLDQQPRLGVNYYRLAQQDIDGSLYYSDIRSIRFESELAVQIFPNPVTDKLTVAMDQDWEVLPYQVETARPAF
ncbi:MAG: hypothetical protein AAF598_09005, partial [Bacteroidota bacterium]